ncbi:MAG: hypothetical protein R3C69_18290 [Geminicoccaceae bacterium]
MTGIFRPPTDAGRPAAGSHRLKGGGDIARSPVGESNDAEGGVEIGVGRGQDSGFRTAGREPGDIDPAGIDAVVAHHPRG